MLWLYFGIITAFLFAIVQLLNKKIIHDSSPLYIGYGRTIYYSIICLILFPFFWNKFDLSLEFFLLLLAHGLFATGAQYFLLKSFKSSNISKVTPILTLTPVFTLFLGIIFLNEVPPITGFIGLFLIIAGLYFLNVKKAQENLMEPFVLLIKEKGPRYMLIASLLWGITSVIAKQALNVSNVISVVLWFVLFMVPFFFIFSIIKNGKRSFSYLKVNLKQAKGWLILIVLVELVMLTFQNIAMSVTNTAYIIALKRTAALFVIIFAYFLFKEKENFWITFWAAAIIILGIILLVI